MDDENGLTVKKRKKEHTKKKETPQPTTNDAPPKKKLPIRVRPPRLQPQDLIVVPHLPPFQPVEGYNNEQNDELSLYTTEDHPTNKRGFRYMHCCARPSFPSVLYMVAEVAPFNARVSIEDRSPHVFISKSCNIVSTEKGFRSARANVCIREGCWYFEVKILKANDGSGSHVRLGITRREASLEAPVGCDAYGYGLRDVAGEKIHLSRPRQFMNESFSTGDVIGFKVYIPPRPDDDDAIDVFRDRFPIRYKGQLYYETLEYVSTKPMEELLSPKLRKKTSDASVPQREGSYVRVYKNGKDMGVAYKDLLEFMPPNSKFQPHLVTHEADDGMLGYFPTISVFRGGMGQFNFGPDFDYEPSDNDGMQARPLSERYDEQIAEDIVYDIIDEVDFEKIDRIADEQKQNEKIKTEDQVVKEEIKREEIAGPSILPEYGDVDMPDAGPISHAAQPVHTAPESSTFGAMEDVEPSGDREISAVELREAEPVNEPNGDEAIVESNAKQHTDKSSQSGSGSISSILN